MARKKRLQSDFNLSEHQVTSLARVLLPAIREYLLSEQGKKGLRRMDGKQTKTTE